MSKYTTELRYIIDNFCGLDEDADIMDKITAAAPKIFNFDFPIWDEEDRTMLECMILQKYYMREIAFETVGLWKFYLHQKMVEIMPYYVELYKTTQAKYDFLAPYTLTETYTETTHRDHTETTDNTVKETGDSSETTDNTVHQTDDMTDVDRTTVHTENTTNQSGTDNGQNDSKRITSDLPQATLSAANVDYATGSETVENTDGRTTHGESDANTDETNDGERYGTNIRDIRNDTTKSGTTSRNVTGDTYRDGEEDGTHVHEWTRTGNTSSNYSQLLKDYRDSILMIPPLIIKDLGCLFFSLW